ncbi:hypothetical protein V1477_020611 [Vespula maculifrons]|uniref:Uncharacterized protein n=2 Tax=Vespula TaxID=7451 RepID=A0A834KB75_VESVU|nr:hypothetical protein HZH66_004818 [Vespula vulgaris]
MQSSAVAAFGRRSMRSAYVSNPLGFKAWLDGAKLSAATTTTTTAMTTKTTARLRKSRGPTLKYDKRTCVYGRVASSKFCLCAELYRPCSWRVDAQRAPLTRRHEPYWY